MPSSQFSNNLPSSRTMTLLSGVGLNHGALAPFSMRSSSRPRLEPHTIMTQVLGPIITTARARSASLDSEDFANLTADFETRSDADEDTSTTSDASSIYEEEVADEPTATNEDASSRLSSLRNLPSESDTPPHVLRCTNLSSADELAQAAENLTISSSKLSSAPNNSGTTSPAPSITSTDLIRRLPSRAALRTAQRSRRADAFFRTNSLAQSRYRLAARRALQVATAAALERTPPASSDDNEDATGGDTFYTLAMEQARSTPLTLTPPTSPRNAPGAATATSSKPVSETAGLAPFIGPLLPWYFNPPPPVDDLRLVSLRTGHFRGFTQGRTEVITVENTPRRSLRELRRTKEKCRRAEDHVYGWVGGWCREQRAIARWQGSGKKSQVGEQAEEDGERKETVEREGENSGVMRTLRERIGRLVQRGKRRVRRGKRE